MIKTISWKRNEPCCVQAVNPLNPWGGSLWQTTHFREWLLLDIYSVSRYALKAM